MTARFDVTYKGRLLGLGYVSSHPSALDMKIASVVPVTRKGKWEDNTLEVAFENPVHDIVGNTTSDIDALVGALGQAAIEASKVEIRPSAPLPSGTT